MNDDADGKHRFHLPIPLWTVAIQPALKQHGDLPQAIPRMTSAEFGPFVPFFTSLPKARAFVKGWPKTRLVAIELKTPKAIRVILESHQAQGVSYACLDFDPPTRRGGFLAIDGILADLREQFPNDRAD